MSEEEQPKTAQDQKDETPIESSKVVFPVLGIVIISVLLVLIIGLSIAILMLG